MKKNVLLFIVFTAFVFSVKQAKAEFHLEPFVGMAFNSSAEMGGAENSVSGTTVGARVGFTKAGFSVGMDGRRNAWVFDPDSGGSKSNYTFTQLGLFIGYELPTMVRFWGSYVLSMEGVDDDDTDNKLKEGSGMVFGVGFKVVPFMSLNFELSNLSTAKAETSAAEVDFDADYTAYTIGVSLPLSI